MGEKTIVKSHVLKNRSFMFLWTGQSISLFGIAIYTTCLPFLIYHAGGGAVEIGLAHSFFIIPQIIFLLVGGVFVDRWPRKIILIICDLIRGLAVAGIALLLLLDALMLVHVYMLTGLLGFLSTFYRPAVRGITPQIVTENQLISANSMRSISQQLSEMIGPVVGGALVVNIGLHAAYGTHSLTFLLSALFISFVTVKQKESQKALKDKTKKSGKSFWEDFKDGWQAIKERAWLGVSILLGSLANIGIASFDVIMLPVLANESYSGILAYSWILSSMAVGSLACALIISKINQFSRRGILYYAFMGLSGLGVFLLSLKPDLWLVLLIVALIGFSLTAFIIIWESAVQALVDEELLGRVTSFQMFGGLALLPVGYWLFGIVIERFGIEMAMAIAGICIIVVAVLGLRNKKIRELN